jgi:hypothetical protein
MTKREHVPETKDVKPNREQRRHPEQQQPRPEDEALTRAHEAQAEVVKQGNQDVTSVRAKNSGHGKKTADKWNQ